MVQHVAQYRYLYDLIEALVRTLATGYDYTSTFARNIEPLSESEDDAYLTFVSPRVINKGPAPNVPKNFNPIAARRQDAAAADNTYDQAEAVRPGDDEYSDLGAPAPSQRAASQHAVPPIPQAAPPIPQAAAPGVATSLASRGPPGAGYSTGGPPGKKDLKKSKKQGSRLLTFRQSKRVKGGETAPPAQNRGGLAIAVDDSVCFPHRFDRHPAGARDLTKSKFVVT